MSPEDGKFYAIIPDGNRRWAAENQRSVVDGHAEGAERFKEIVAAARDEQRLNILAAWGLSGNNFKRGDAAVRAILALVDRMLIDLRDNWMDEPENQNLRLVHMGRIDRMRCYPEGREVITRLGEIREHTRARTGMAVILCLDYQGLDEQQRAIQMWQQHRSPSVDDLPDFVRSIGGAIDGQHKDAVRQWLKTHHGFLGRGMEWQAFLDLPRQGIPYQPVDLILRTGIQNGQTPYDGEFLHPYRGETRVRSTEVLFPALTAERYLAECCAFEAEDQRRGV